MLQKHSRTQVSVSTGQDSNNYTNVSLHMRSLACKEHLWSSRSDRELWLTSVGLATQDNSSREKAALEQLGNRVSGCLNGPQRDALSFPAGKADQSHFSSPWSQGGNGNVGGPVKDGVEGGMSGEMTVLSGVQIQNAHLVQSITTVYWYLSTSSSIFIF